LKRSIWIRHQHTLLLANHWRGPGETSGGTADRLEFCYNSDNNKRWNVRTLYAVDIATGAVVLLQTSVVHLDGPDGTQRLSENFTKQSTLAMPGNIHAKYLSSGFHSRTMNFARGECVAPVAVEIPSATLTDFTILGFAIIFTEEGCM